MESEAGSRGTNLRRRHLPALDGLRAIAVMAVILYHLGFGWAGGGYLGVDLFFVLSGFLITGLLVEEHVATGGISLSRFYGRRARRLFPALLLVLGAVVLYAALGGPNVDVHALQGDMPRTLFYVANWHFIASGNPYFAPFITPSPLEHTWSLAIEEQFYVVWPLLLILLVKAAKRDWRRLAVVSAAVLALASVVDMALQTHGAADVSRAYFGTDSRAFELMIGALLALVMENRHHLSDVALRVLHGAGIASLATIVVGFGLLGGPPHWMFYGGFLGITTLTAVVIAGVARQEHGPLGGVLSLRPMQWIGRVSYGLYLWHWPVCVFLTPASTGLAGWEVDIARLALTFGLATVSFYVVEQPIRQRRVPGLTGVPGLVAAGGVALSIVLVLGVAPVGATAPAVASSNVVPLSGAHNGPKVAGAGGYGDEVPITLPTGVVVDRAHPLRVLIFGDSVMQNAELGIAESLQSTGVVTVAQRAFPGFGISPGAPLNPPGGLAAWHRAQGFLAGLIRQVHPQLVIASWSDDSSTAKARPTYYRVALNAVLRRLLSPGDGVAGVILLQMPVFGPVPPFLVPGFERDPPYPGPINISGRTLYQSWNLRAAGLHVWNEIIARTPIQFPGRVMYLPVGSSVELDGHYSSWLPPTGDPSAPRTSWVRVRIRDNVHLCPFGIVRYAEPVLYDLTQIFHLPPAKRAWWSSDYIPKQLNTLWPLSTWCPNDHPPS